MPVERSRRTVLRLLPRDPIEVLLLAGALWSAWTVTDALRHRVALQILLGAVLWLVLGAIVAGAIASLVAIVRGRRTASGRHRSAPAARLLFCLLVLGWLGHAAWLQPYRRMYSALALALCLGVFGAILLARRESAKAPRAGRRRVERALFQLCLAALLIELGLRGVAALHPLPILARDDSVAHKLRTYRLPPGQLRWGFPCNSAGYYDEEFLPAAERATPVAVMIGDSFSAAVVPHHFHFTTVCERTLGRGAVYNMGVPAIGPAHYLHLLRHEALPLRPAVIAVNLFIGNDLDDVARGGARGGLLRSWLSRDELLGFVVPQRLWRIAAEQQRHEAPLALQGEQLVTRRLGTPAELVDAFPWLGDHRLEQPTFSAPAFLDIETRRAAAACRPDASFEALFATLLEMQRAAGGTPLVLVLIPDEFQVEDPLWRDVVAALPDTALERDRPQALLAEFCARHGIPVLDLLPLLRAVRQEPDGWRHCYHLADTHFNARGNRVAGEAMAGLLAPYLK